MSAEYANIVFDDYYRPSDALEDELAVNETKAIRALDRVIGSSEIGPDEHVDLAYFLAIQACRYPEHYSRRLDLGRYLAVALRDWSIYPDAAALNGFLIQSGLLPGASFSDVEFEQLRSTPDDRLDTQLEMILTAHGYEAYFNSSLVIAAAMPVAEHLLALRWELLKTPTANFILSDRPMPLSIGCGFSLALSSELGLRVSRLATPVTKIESIKAQAAPSGEVDRINGEVRGRARELICGAGRWVQAL